MWLYLLCLAAASLLALLLYGWDKRCAIRGTRRIAERTLLLVGVLGGAPGALAAMHLFRHKTRHVYFWAINGVALLLQAVFLILLSL